MKKVESIGLCHRCEHRAKFLEYGYGPRCECKESRAVYSCYMYEPVTPLVLKPNKGEKRPPVGVVGWAMSGRMHAVEHAKCKLKLIKGKKGFTYYKEPEEVKK